MSFCVKCGNQLAPDSQFCESCGAKVEAAAAAPANAQPSASKHPAERMRLSVSSLFGNKGEPGRSKSDQANGAAASRLNVNLRVILLAVLGVALLSIAVLLFVNRNTIFPDEHYQTGIKLLIAKDYDGAASQFRLSIEDRPEDVRAKGMLAYSVVRTKLQGRDSNQDPTVLRSTALDLFLTYYAQLSLDQSTDQISDLTERKWFKDRIDDAQHQVRDQFKLNNIPFEDWGQFNSGIAAAAKEVYNIPVSPDDPIDNLAKDVSAALLAKAGNGDAINYLVRRCANDPDLLGLTLVAGDNVVAALAKSAQSKDSFLAQDGQASLCYLALKPAILAFVKDHPGVRCVHKGDLHSDQGMIYDSDFDISKQSYYTQTGVVTQLAFGGVTNELLVSDSIQGRSDIDPTALRVVINNVDKGQFMALIGGFDATSGKYVSRTFYWGGKQWAQLAIGLQGQTEPVSELSTALPTAPEFYTYEDQKTGKTWVSIGTRECRDAARTRMETRFRTVPTGYQYQNQTNPQPVQDPVTHLFVPFNQMINVPITTQQQYTVPVNYKERAVGTNWIVFAFDPSNTHLWFRRSNKWIEGASSPFNEFTGGEEGE
ncbi:MAG: zinc ribbon domain-containing protein [Capsulimonadaceae bacterium]|nr:zinc ribbon domain-containing protein [Capsulimonadaceae bacterium]